MNRLYEKETNFPAKIEQDMKYKGTSKTVFYLLLDDYRPSVGLNLTLKELLFLVFCSSYLSVSTDTDIPIMRVNGNN